MVTTIKDKGIFDRMVMNDEFKYTGMIMGPVEINKWREEHKFREFRDFLYNLEDKLGETIYYYCCDYPDGKKGLFFGNENIETSEIIRERQFKIRYDGERSGSEFGSLADSGSATCCPYFG